MDHDSDGPLRGTERHHRAYIGNERGGPDATSKGGGDLAAAGAIGIIIAILWYHTGWPGRLVLIGGLLGGAYHGYTTYVYSPPDYVECTTSMFYNSKCVDQDSIYKNRHHKEVDMSNIRPLD